MTHAIRPLVVLMLSLGIGGCTTLFRPLNQPVKQISAGNGYAIQKVRGGDTGENVVLLAFSGGGTRAAALSYGVLKELNETSIQSRGQRVRLLDEVDSISSVSGGSFTAAYYGLLATRSFPTMRGSFSSRAFKAL